MRDINELVMNIVRGKRAAHAFIIEGMAGEARSAFITALAQGLECNCEDEGARPCGICPSCRQVAAGTSMDVIYMQKSTGSGKSARPSYKVDDASEFIERLNMGAYGRFLIGIIEDSDSLSEIVQNKLLKTLEEPGRDTILILAASNRDNLLSTVRSRCSEIRMTDYISGDDHTEDMSESDNKADTSALNKIVGMFCDKRTAFYEFRSAIDKHIKSKDDAFILLDRLEDEMHSHMTGGQISAQNDTKLSSLEAAAIIELASVARMDIKRDMAYSKALKRLFLELRS